MATRQHINEYGSSFKHDPDFKGPKGLSKRSCTDVFCLLLFVIAIVVWVFVGRYAYQNGDPYKLVVPADSNGRRCGKDSEMLNKPYLLFFDITDCASPSIIHEGCLTTQVCVSKCPDDAWDAHAYIDGDLPFNKRDIESHLYCKEGVEPVVKNLEDLKTLINGGLCAPSVIPTSEICGRCLPSLKGIKEAADKLHFNQTIADKLKMSTNIIQKLTDLGEVGEKVVEDIMNTWQYLVISLVVTMIFCLLYITMLRWIASLMVWLSLLAVTAVLGCGVYASYSRYKYVSSLPEESPYPPGKQNLKNYINELLLKKSTWFVLTLISAVLFIIITLMIIFLRKRIVIAVTLIKEGSKAVGNIISALFFPVFPWILQLGVIIYFLICGAYLLSVGRDVFKVYGLQTNPNCVCKGDFYKNLQECNVTLFNENCQNPVGGGVCLNAGCYFVRTESNQFVTYLQMYNLFLMFWAVWFLSGLAEMILAATFATWYWTFNKRNLPFFTLTSSIYTAIRYHLGTVAFGSSLIAVCSFLRAILEFVELKLKKYENGFTKAIFCVFRCCFWCLHKFICFVNTNAYIMCAIHGKNFCTSAQEAFLLLMRNVIRVVVVDKVTDFVFFLGKLSISVMAMASAYLIFSRPVRRLDNSGRDVVLNYYFIPVLAIGFQAYLIASVFFSVYSMAVDTLFLCFLEDCERNDGSPEKPYFMSKKLMRILGKKNKKNS